MASDNNKRFIPYGKQTVSEEDRLAVLKVLEGDWLTSGPEVENFEKAVCEYVGCDFAVAVNSGTAALDIAIAALELEAGSEIITTPFTWISTVNAILFNRMVPVLADIDPQTYNLSVESVRAKITSKTKAILFVDYSGQPADVTAFRALADEFGLYLIEDAAQSFSGSLGDTRVGNLDADMTIFSFHPVKHITTGEGGMVTTNNPDFFSRLKMLRNHGVTKSFKDRLTGENSAVGDGVKALPGYMYDVKYLSKNYRICDFQCALGRSQLLRSDEFLASRVTIAKRYDEAFSGNSLITIPFVKAGRQSAWHLYPILLDRSIDRDVFFAKMREKGIGVNVHHMPAYSFSYHKSLFDWKAEDYPICDDVYSRTVSLPIFPLLSLEDQEFVIQTVIELVTELQEN